MTASAERLRLVCESGARLLDGLELHAVERRICRESERLIGASGAFLATHLPDLDLLEVVAGTGSLAPALRRTLPARGSSREALRAGKVRVLDADEGRALGDELGLDGAGDSRFVVAPLAGPGAPLGVLCAMVSLDADGADADLEALELFAALAGRALETARLYAVERARAEEFDLLRSEREELVRQLEDLHAAEVAVSSDLDLDAVLQTVTDRARDLTDADYGAIGVLDADASGFGKLVTSGLPEELRERIGALPKGEGLLGAVIRERRTIRVSDVAGDLRSSGIPPLHPHMTSFLGVPIQTGDRVYGNLYLTNKRGAEGFTERDASIVEMLAAHAAVAIKKAHQFLVLERLLEELRLTQSQRDRFYAFVNHDLRNACSGVLMWAERLLGRSPEDREIADKIRRGSEHALRLVQDVLDLENMGRGRLEMWPRVIVVADMLEAAADSVRPEAERRGIEVRVEEVGPDLRLVADPDRVLQVIGNLLNNAVKFSPDGSEVRVSGTVRRPENVSEWVAIAVADDGPGIPPEDLERIFGEYVKSKETSRGLGVGLTLSRRLAEYMGGRLTVDSVVGEGSTFTLWLPHGQEPERRAGWIG
ncbi:MAG: GAF domain-containing protein [Gemmatimonadota bacterium]